VAGTPQWYTPFLLYMLEYQRPKLFANVDERLPRRKRWKGQTFQTDGKFGISEEYELDEDEEDEEIPLDYGLGQDIRDLEEMPIFGKAGR
jgi:hypothetical protein